MSDLFKRAVLCRLLLLVFLVFTLSCSKGKEEKPGLSDNVVALVNQEKIYTEEFESGLKRFLNKYDLSKDDVAAGGRSPKDTVLDQLIQGKLFQQEIRRLSITVSAKTLDDELRFITGEYTPGEFSKKLKETNISFYKWKDEIRKKLLIKKLIEQEVLTKIMVSPKEIMDYYEANQDVFLLPKRVEASHIIVSEESKAYNIHEDLLAGVDFKVKAREHSIGVESASGGQMGIFSPGQLPKEFDRVLFSLKPGQISDVIKTPYGYHIFKVNKVLKAKKMDFGEAKEKIKEILLKKKEEVFFALWLKRLKADSNIVVNKNYFQKKKGVRKNA